MPTPLPSKPRALITGAGSGLGRAIALNLAARGGRVLVTDRDLTRAEGTAAEVSRLGGEGHPFALDVTDPSAFEAAAEALDARFGGVDLVVNNAGVAVAGPIGEAPLEDWHFAIDINLFGVIHGCHVFAPRFRAAGKGAILNVASAAGIASAPEMGFYNVSKAGVISLTETLHAELTPHGVSVSVLCPTFFPTNLMDSFRSPSDRQRRLAEALFRRATTTAEAVAEAGLRGLEAGDLVIIPQRDGKFIRRAKGLAPELYARMMAGGGFKRLEKLMARR